MEKVLVIIGCILIFIYFIRVLLGSIIVPKLSIWVRILSVFEALTILTTLILLCLAYFK
jgi:hypothetical protein